MTPSPHHPTTPKTLYLIDGSGFIFRAYHALPALTNAAGTPVGAVLGFVNMIVKLMEGHTADSVAVVFDAGRQTFRNRIYADYKAHRPPPPDDLIPQFAIVREAAEALSLASVELADYEADDIIATYARQAREAGMNVVIISSDKDLMQLIGEGVSMFDAMKQKTIGPEQVMEKFGVAPEKVRHVLSLIGDTSDNVPGVPGIGPKTAAELIGMFGDLEGLLSRSGEIPQVKRRELIAQHAQQARLSYELIGLRDDVPVPVALEALSLREPDHALLFAFLQRYGLKSALARMQQKFGVQDSGFGIQDSGKDPSLPESRILNPESCSYSILRDEAALAQWIARATSKGRVAFDTETTSLNVQQAELVGFSLCVEAGEACYVPLLHRKDSGFGIQHSGGHDLFSLNPESRILAPEQIPFDAALALLKPLLEDESVLKIGHNIKYDLQVMRRYGVAMRAVDDSMLLSYVLHAGEHGQGMDELSERYLGHQTIAYDQVTGTGRNRLRFDAVEIEKAGAYAAEDADVTLRLWERFKSQVAALKLLTLYETIERPLIGVLAEMEALGVKVDLAQLSALSADFAERMQALEREIHALAGQAFNIGSPRQLGEMLFEKMQLGGGKKSGKSGAYGTDSGVLEELAAQGHALPARVLEWRQLSKLKSTYTDALVQQIDAGSRRVHTCYAMAATTTGRLSSSDPNLQNIPIRTIEGKKIRQAFVADSGYTLLSADYSQIELRLLAHMADIPTLKEAFRNGDDIHAITAGQMFGLPASEVSADLRRSAKMINFGIIYGMSAHGLAVRLGIGRAEAGAYIERYFAQYPGIRDYMESNKAFARQHGYVETLYGRRCHVPAIRDKNPARRQFAERAAINAPLQGTAADIIKRAMVSIGGARGLGLGASKNTRTQPLEPSTSLRMLLQVHDELVFEVTEGQGEAARAFVKRQMEQAAQLSVPLTVETGLGTHWGEAH